MTEQEWWAIAGRTSRSEKPESVRQRGFRLGLVGEAGEVCDVLKKYALHGHTLEMTRKELAKELGDVYWYCVALQGQLLDRTFDMQLELLPNDEGAEAQALAVTAAALDYVSRPRGATHVLLEIKARLESLAHYFDVEWSDVLQANADKLLRRFPDGKFTPAASIARVDVK